MLNLSTRSAGPARAFGFLWTVSGAYRLLLHFLVRNPFAECRVKLFQLNFSLNLLFIFTRKIDVVGLG